MYYHTSVSYINMFNKAGCINPIQHSVLTRGLTLVPKRPGYLNWDLNQSGDLDKWLQPKFQSRTICEITTILFSIYIHMLLCIATLLLCGSQ